MNLEPGEGKGKNGKKSQAVYFEANKILARVCCTARGKHRSTDVAERQYLQVEMSALEEEECAKALSKRGAAAADNSFD